MNLLADDIKTITLLVERYCVQRAAEWPFADSPRCYADYAVEEGRLMLRMMQDVLVQRECMAEYPANWIEALKARWAPQWFLRRWPVITTRIDMEVLYPQIAIPEKQHTVKLRVWTPVDYLPSYSGHRP